MSDDQFLPQWIVEKFDLDIFFLRVLLSFFNIISQLGHCTLFMFLSSNFGRIITCIVSCTWFFLLVAERCKVDVMVEK
jgi:hypothetical protein